jgi:hypothetical protein
MLCGHALMLFALKKRKRLSGSLPRLATHLSCRSLCPPTCPSPQPLTWHTPMCFGCRKSRWQQWQQPQNAGPARHIHPCRDAHHCAPGRRGALLTPRQAQLGSRRVSSCSLLPLHASSTSVPFRGAAALACSSGCPARALLGRRKLCLLPVRSSSACSRAAASSATCEATRGWCVPWRWQLTGPGWRLQRRAQAQRSGCGTTVRGGAWPLCQVRTAAVRLHSSPTAF